MRNIAIFGSPDPDQSPPHPRLARIELDGVSVTCGLVDTPAPNFDAQAPDNAQQVLVKTRAFSCNYRDKALILAAAQRARSNAYFVVGSEFVGHVADKGSDVRDLEIGDRVIGSNHYTGAGVSAGVPEGLPTNHASREYQILHQAKLIKVPRCMPDDVAAAYSLGAQTTYSMIRKLELEKAANVLVTAASSNTSLFAINALRRCGVNVYATSRSLRHQRALRALGVAQLFPLGAGPRLDMEVLATFAREIGGFDAVIDPFFDLHLAPMIDLIRAGGSYVTCGLWAQYATLKGEKKFPPEEDLVRIMFTAMFKNLRIVGNCIGQTSDLAKSLEDYAAGRLSVVVDSVLSGDDVAPFLNRTYNTPNRFGKVVYMYD